MEKNPAQNPLVLRMLGMGKKYFVKTPWWLKKIYPKRVWNKSRAEKIIYLTFDDGPEKEITPFVLDQLRQYNAKASFFCIGQNVETNHLLYLQIQNEGHVVANHTYSHLNGWNTDDDEYLKDVGKAAAIIKSGLFRPPYGRMTRSQERKMNSRTEIKQIVMWDVLSGDFDEATSAEQCLENVTSKTRNGSIIVFHDSLKASEKLKKVLPEILRYFSQKGFEFRSLS